MMSEASRAVKRRRKVVKSCTFCRKRKLKCDHGKPMCNQCLERKLPNCLYTDNFNFQLTTDELFSDSPNVELIRRIKELEEKLERNSTGHSVECDRSVSPSSSSSQFSSTISSSSKNNPLWGYRTFIQMNGQSLVFGPTSWRTTVAAHGSRFVAEYKKVWDMTERCKWMSVPVNSLHSSLPPAEYSPQSALCAELPAFKEIRKTVLEYFDDDYYHGMFKVLDRDKTLKDLERCFIRSSKDEERVVNIIAPGGDGNLCRAANILMILCIMKSAGSPTPSFDKFFMSLTALNLSSKLSFVERAQFLLLRFFNNVYCSYVCSEAPQMGGMIAELCECSMNLGLAEASTYYEGKENEVGPLWILNNIWLWTLYADVLAAFELGKPLLISDDHFDPQILKQYEQPVEGSGDFLPRRRLILTKFIEMSRHCVTEINSRLSSGNLDVTIEHLIGYISENLLPIRFYTTTEMFSSVDLFDVIVLAPSLGMLLNLHNIQRMWIKSTTAYTRNGLIKFGFLSLSLSVNSILGVRQKTQHLESNHKALHFASLLVNPLLMRVLSEMYATFFHKLSLFEDGLIKPIDWGTRTVELHNLDVPLSEYYSFVGALEMFRKIIDELFDPSKPDLQDFFSKSYTIGTTLALERVSRTLLDRARESRTKAENYCTLTGEGTISQETLNEMTDVFWSVYEQQLQDFWSVKPQDI